MLQTTDVHRRTNGNHPRQSARIAIMFLMVAVGIGSIGIRGLAQIRTDVGSSDTETANLQVDLLSKDKAANQVTGVFAREPLDPDIIGPNNSGMFVLRTRELFERPEFEQLRGLANTGLAAVISELSRELAASKVRPTVDIGGIEWIAGQANMTIRSGTDDEMKDKTRLMVGGSRLVMKLTQPFDLKQWIQKYFPDTKSHDIDGTTVYVLPNTPFLGPYPLGVAQLDNRTVATRTLPREVIDEHKPKVPVTPTFWGNTAKVSRWAPAWNRSDGGLGTFLVTDSEIYDLGRHRDDMSDVERTLGDLGNNVHLRTSLMSYAFDIDASTSAVRVRMNYSHSSRGTATQSAKELADAVTLLATPEGQMYLRGNSEPSDGDVQWHIMLSDALTGLTTDVKELDDGTADLTVALSFPLEPLVKMFLRDIQEEFQSTNDNVRVREARDTEPASRN